MKIFIVHAHPEPCSFNGALTDTACTHLARGGYDVVVSDLYAMDWRARSDRANFTSIADASYFKQQAEEAHATELSTFAPDIVQEQEKLFACNVLILQFPLWWFSMPALLKGWVDRVFAMGRVYGGGHWYERGRLEGRRAMVSVTTGGPSSMYGPDGLNGDINMLLYPIQHGILRFVGFDVLPPFIVWEPALISAEKRRAYLAAYEQRLDHLLKLEPLQFPELDQYDPTTFRLRTPPPAAGGAH
ncbi:MAG: NAD(P)H-dependent oxidoreductase [Kiloniellaceae bacterium]